VKCFARKVDAASDEDVRGVIDEAIKTFGRLDVFFANAGVASGDHIKDETAESFMRMMKINALSVFLAIKHGAEAMQVTGKGGKNTQADLLLLLHLLLVFDLALDQANTRPQRQL